VSRPSLLIMFNTGSPEDYLRDDESAHWDEVSKGYPYTIEAEPEVCTLLTERATAAGDVAYATAL
jgi:hypothetical protein